MTVASPKQKPFMVGETGDEATSPSQADWIKNSLFAEVKASYPDVKAVLYFDSYNCATHNDYTIGWPAGQITAPPSVRALRAGKDHRNLPRLDH